MKQLEPAEIVRWFRRKAAEFNAIADNLEQTFQPGGAPSPVAPGEPGQSSATVSLEKIHQLLLTRRALRLKEIADHFG